MLAQKRLQVIGAVGSPYTRKMLALMRYRHIPYNITWADPATKLDEMGIQKPRPTFLPTFLFDDGAGNLAATCDSTPIIRRLEADYIGRSVLPTDPALAFIDYLIEDFADEWCTKYMFHYRWHAAEDADNAGTLLPLNMNVCLAHDTHVELKRVFSERQIGRLYVVGSNDTTAPVIDASYRRFLMAMEGHLANQPFVLGDRPSASDFALYGQLTQLVGYDPTPRTIAHELSPRTVAWVGCMEDLSGVPGSDQGWGNLDQLSGGLSSLLLEIGRVYVPALLANAQAVKADQKTWQGEIDSQPWVQQTFPYQAKCLTWIREQYHALNDMDRMRVDEVLLGTGCEALL